MQNLQKSMKKYPFSLTNEEMYLYSSLVRENGYFFIPFWQIGFLASTKRHERGMNFVSHWSEEK